MIGSDNDNDNLENSKIELTEAEAEAIERGLQVCLICQLVNLHYNCSSSLKRKLKKNNH